MNEKKGREAGASVVGNKGKKIREEGQNGKREESSCKKRQAIQGTENKRKWETEDRNEERREKAWEMGQRRCNEDIPTK